MRMPMAFGELLSLASAALARMLDMIFRSSSTAEMFLASVSLERMTRLADSPPKCSNDMEYGEPGWPRIYCLALTVVFILRGSEELPGAGAGAGGTGGWAGVNRSLGCRIRSLGECQQTVAVAAVSIDDNPYLTRDFAGLSRGSRVLVRIIDISVE